ncbi:hypothetical protein GCM10010459_19820 [Microbacterium schleiferi]
MRAVGVVVDDTAALPYADQPRQWRKLGGEVGGKIDHGASALAAVQILHDDTRDEHDRERRERKKAHEEEFERYQVHRPSLSRIRRARPDCAPDTSDTQHASGHRA